MLSAKISEKQGKYSDQYAYIRTCICKLFNFEQHLNLQTFGKLQLPWQKINSLFTPLNISLFPFYNDMQHLMFFKSSVLTGTCLYISYPV